MTRINSAIPPRCLTDEHLLAEHREIKRLPYCLRAAIASGSVSRIPERFTLGRGHVLFFIDKLGFARRRFRMLYEECLFRHFSVQDYERNFYGDVPEEYCNEYEPTSDEYGLLAARIRERIISSPKTCWHYNGNPIPKERAIGLLECVDRAMFSATFENQPVFGRI